METTRLLAIVAAAVFATGCSNMTNSSNKSGSAQTSALQGTADGNITSKVKSAFEADPDLKSSKIDVSTSAGVVKIKGDIKTFALRRKAEELVKAVPGVKSVDNQLLITG